MVPEATSQVSGRNVAIASQSRSQCACARLRLVAATVLFVEDDDRIRLTLRMNLEDDGFRVLEARTGEEGVALAVGETAEPVDVAIVDLLLPGISGFDVVREIRRNSRMPIVILTAQSDTHDVVAGLEAGADDYVIKPVAPKELAARLRALVRRSTLLAAGPTEPGPADAGPVELVVGPLVIRPTSGDATWFGEPLTLTRTEFKILCELAAHPDQVVTREQLLERVWGYDYLGDMRLVDSQMYRLRGKLEPDTSEPKHLLTVRGMGYKLVP
jgi:DNA-binding response OmpR family regulator